MASAKITPAQAYAALIAAGAPASLAMTLTAIGGAESGWDVNSAGDYALENATWGPSVGVWGIRTIKAHTGTGQRDDITYLTGGDEATNLAHQAAAAVSIYHTNGLKGWTTWKTGAYTKFLTQAAAGAGQAATGNTGTLPGTNTGTSGTATATNAGLGPDWAPWNWGSDLTKAQASVEKLAVNGTAAVLGGIIVIVGLAILAKPAIQGASQTASQVAGVAAMAA